MAGPTKYSDLTWLGSDRPLARFLGRPLANFLRVEAAGGIVLLVATAVALIWANSPWSDSYVEFWHTEIDLTIGDISVFSNAKIDHLTLEEFVNDLLMALFFFVVGLEIKRELVTGQLRHPRDAALPALAAVGGMVVPALVYLSLNAGGVGQDGWGIPVATDIAFAVGVVSLLGSRVPRQLRVFLLSLAIVDDIGAILIIAIFYTAEVQTAWLLAAIAIAVAVWVLRKVRVWYEPFYFVLGAFLWWATFKSGIHATIAGVVMGLLTPATPLQSPDDAREFAAWIRDKPEVFPVDITWAAFNLRESVSVAERLNIILHPFTSFFIIPLFALANAGVILSREAISDAASSPVTWGIILGLVVGKSVGVSVFALGAAKLGLARLPAGASASQIVGLGMVAGIGFTVSLFITALSFDGAAGLEDQAKIGILIASLVAAVLGLVILSRARPAPLHSSPPS